ncbi:uncharacterized protein LOC143253779 isoform X2 [Tachypleus tridentatus]|uniref:uncharacterized protein LOC143253779 isoform X2 n=1 Tax=Tachypleus tridentatus TaxID=6853 RepID=UPI003FD34CEF
MSLETLLEAAKYLEYKTQAKARGEEPRDYQTFANLSAVSASACSSCPPVNQTIRNLPEFPEEGSSSPTDQGHVDEQKEKRRTGGAGTREVHNKLEKNRRAHLKECFENLKAQLPNIDERKISNLSILRGALRYIQTLKKVERECEHEMEQLAREKITFQQRLAALKKDLSAHLDHVDLNKLLPDPDNETTTTASEAGESDVEEDTEMSSFYNFLQSSETSSTSSTPSNTPPQSTGITSPVCVEKKREDSGVKTTVTFLQTATSLVSPVSMTPGFTPSVFTGMPKKRDTKSVSVTMVTGKNTTVASAKQNCLGSQGQGTSDSVHKLNSANTKSAQILNQSVVSKLLNSSDPKITQVPPLTSTNVLTNGPLKSFTKTVPSIIEGPVATGFSVPKLVTLPNSSMKPVLNHSLVCVTPGPLAQPQSVISLTPVSSTSKSVIINNQAAPISSDVATPSLVNHVATKPAAIPAPDTTGTDSVITQRGIVLTSGATVIPQPNLQFMKPVPQILHHAVAPRTHIVPLGGSQVNSMRHHLVTASIKPVPQTGQPKTRFSHLPSVGHVTHVVPSPSVTAPVSCLVSGATAVSAITPLVSPLSVVSPGGPINQTQLITQPHHLGKVLATTPILKTSDQIPIIQSQFLQPTVGLVKPVVMVSVPSVRNGSQVTATVQQQGASTVSVPQ